MSAVCFWWTGLNRPANRSRHIYHTHISFICYLFYYFMKKKRHLKHVLTLIHFKFSRRPQATTSCEWLNEWLGWGFIHTVAAIPSPFHRPGHKALMLAGPWLCVVLEQECVDSAKRSMNVSFFTLCWRLKRKRCNSSITACSLEVLGQRWQSSWLMTVGWRASVTFCSINYERETKQSDTSLTSLENLHYKYFYYLLLVWGIISPGMYTPVLSQRKSEDQESSEHSTVQYKLRYKRSNRQDKLHIFV